MTLTPEHLTYLYKRGLTDAVIQRRGYYSVPNVNQARDCTQLPFRSFTGAALVIPSHDIHGAVNGAQLRLDNPVPVPDGKGGTKPLRYLNPSGRRPPINIPRPVREQVTDSSYPLVFTEGAAKGDALATRGIASVVLPGVGMWGVPLEQNPDRPLRPEIAAIPLDGREVYIGYDADMLTNKSVRGEARKLAQRLEDQGAKVRFLVPEMVNDNAKTGIDDWIAAHPDGDVWALIVEELPADPVKSYPRTHQGCAERVADAHGDVIGYDDTMLWVAWNGRVWEHDTDSASKVRRLITGLRSTISGELDAMRRAGVGDDEIGKHQKLWHDVQSTGYQAAVLKQLQDLVYKRWDTFDTDPMLFTVGNGTLVFDHDGTVTLRDHDPADRITKGTTVPYDPDAACPFYDETMSKALPDDVRGFIQRVAGYCLTGGNGEQVIVVNHGTGGNLKSTFLDAVKGAIGTHYIDVDPSTLHKSMKEGSAPSPDKMRLKTVRMVSSVETSGSGTSMDTEFLKRISGGEPIVARGLHAATVEFDPQFVLFLSTNSIPNIDDDSHGMWRRVKMVPWSYRMPAEDMLDLDTVRRRLRAESPGILAWLVRGAQDYRRQGLAAPEAVESYTAAVRGSLDWFAAFTGEQVAEDADGALHQSALWQAFRSWRGSDRDLMKVKQRHVNDRARELWGPPSTVMVGTKRSWGWSGRKLEMPTL